MCSSKNKHNITTKLLIKRGNNQLSCFCHTTMALERVKAQEMPIAKNIKENEILLNQTEEAINANLKY